MFGGIFCNATFAFFLNSLNPHTSLTSWKVVTKENLKRSLKCRKIIFISYLYAVKSWNSQTILIFSTLIITSVIAKTA